MICSTTGQAGLTQYAEVNSLLEELLGAIRLVLGRQLVGLYLYGSLVWGDFDYDISDVDLLAVTTEDINTEKFSQLDQMHTLFVRDHKEWVDRIEIAYMSVAALRTFKLRRSQIAIMSPGEPFHVKEAGHDWLINWYLVREKGKIVYGPEPRTLIEPISKQEFIEGVKRQALDWRTWISQTKPSRPYQGYAILTMCRALYARRTGEQVSKKKAAQWAMREFPERAELIRKALIWRDQARSSSVDNEATYPATVDFVNFMIDQIVA